MEENIGSKDGCEIRIIDKKYNDLAFSDEHSQVEDDDEVSITGSLF